VGQKYTSRGKAETGEREGKRRGESVRKRVRKRKIDREGEGRERGGGKGYNPTKVAPHRAGEKLQ
jgi:hypothetical protein